MTAPTIPGLQTPTPTTPGLTVIGLDTSLAATGIASSRGWTELVGYTDKKHPITKLRHPSRLRALTILLGNILTAVGTPDLVVMETPALSRSGGGGHERGWLWWEIYRHLAGREIPVGLVSTNQRMLYATGKGSAPKGQIVDAVARRWPAWETAGDDNLADAVVLMAAGRDWAGCPLAVVPKTHRKAIETAVWPESIPAVTR